MANLPSVWRDNSNPLRSISRMQQQMDRLLEDFFTDPFRMSLDVPQGITQPSFDVRETDSHFVLSFDIPGMSKDDLKIEMLDNQLHIHGERKDEEESGEGRQKIRQRRFGYIDQVFTLPPGVKEEDIQAHFENGVLKLAVPKGEEKKARQISIGEGKSGFFSKLLGKKEERKEPPQKETAA